MVKTGENKAVQTGETKGPVAIRYKGHQEEVSVSDSANWPKTNFKRGKTVMVGATLAAELLKQDEKFELADKEA